MVTVEKSVRITKRVVDAIKPDGTDFYVFDSDLIGFGVRVRKSGPCHTLSAIGPASAEAPR